MNPDTKTNAIYQIMGGVIRNDFPCPKCEHMVPTFRTNPKSILVGCAYDCGPYYMPLADWWAFYDNWEPPCD